MGKFTIKTTNTGYVFNLRAANSEVIATSQVYKSLSSCKQGIASVAKNSVIAEIEDQTLQTVEEKKCPKFEVYKDKAGEFRFRLIATNGQNIVIGQGYSSKSGCMNGIDSIKRNADSPVVMEEANDKN